VLWLDPNVVFLTREVDCQRAIQQLQPLFNSGRCRRTREASWSKQNPLEFPLEQRGRYLISLNCNVQCKYTPTVSFFVRQNQIVGRDAPIVEPTDSRELIVATPVASRNRLGKKKNTCLSLPFAKWVRDHGDPVPFPDVPHASTLSLQLLAIQPFFLSAQQQ